MTLVLEESEDVSLDLLTVLLDSVRKENQVKPFYATSSFIDFQNDFYGILIIISVLCFHPLFRTFILFPTSLERRLLPTALLSLNLISLKLCESEAFIWMNMLK